MPEGKLTVGKLTGQYHADMCQTSHDGSILTRHIVDQQARVSSRADARRFVDVLVSDGDAIQRPLAAAIENTRFGRTCIGKRTLPRHQKKAMQMWIEVLDPLQAGTGEFDG